MYILTAIPYDITATDVRDREKGNERDHRRSTTKHSSIEFSAAGQQGCCRRDDSPIAHPTVSFSGVHSLRNARIGLLDPWRWSLEVFLLRHPCPSVLRRSRRLCYYPGRMDWCRDEVVTSSPLNNAQRSRWLSCQLSCRSIPLSSMRMLCSVSGLANLWSYNQPSQVMYYCGHLPSFTFMVGISKIEEILEPRLSREVGCSLPITLSHWPS
jgi:hypothetical protein